MFMEVSAKNGKNIEQVFAQLATQIALRELVDISKLDWKIKIINHYITNIKFSIDKL